MKIFCKVACVILILVSVFGAYINVNAIKDIKDCKAYWEEVGEESTANINKLEDGIKTLSENHDKYIDGKAQLEKGEMDYADGVVQLEQGKEKLAKGIKQFNAGKKTLAATEKSFGGKGCPVLKQAYDGVNELKAGYSTSKAIATVAAKGGSDYNTVRAAYEGVSGAISKGMTVNQAVEAVAKATVNAQIQANESNIIQGVTAGVKAKARETISKQVEANRDTIKAGIKTQYEASLREAYKKEHPEASDEEINNYIAGKIDEMTKAIVEQKTEENLNGYMSSQAAKDIIDSNVAAQKQKIMNDNLPGAKAKISAVYTNVKNLTASHSQSEAEAMAAAASGISTSKMHQAYNGYIQYKQGVAKLNAASKELAAGKEKLADGEEELVAGNLKLKEGREQIKEFESGRQKVADGLDSAIATEPEGDLESIKDRLGKDFDYMAKDGENLDYHKAMMVVEKAREYQADSTVVVTEELTGRIIGTVAGLAAAILGILAAIFILAGLRKTGSVVGILSAIAAAVSVFKLNAAGTVMSVAAGSETGNTPIICAVVCIIMALVVIITANAKKA